MDDTWVSDLDRERRTLNHSKTRCLGGISFVLRVRDPALLGVVERFLAPLLEDRPSDDGEWKTDRFSVECLYSDPLFDRLAAGLADHPGRRAATGPDGRPVAVVTLADGREVYADAGEGVAWVLDREGKGLLFLHASRARWPAVQYAQAVQEVLIRYVEDNGWAIAHAAAVGTGTGTLLLIGDAGAGKTTLMTALVRAGGAFTANERSFLRRGRFCPHALGFPMVANLSMATAALYPETARLLEDCTTPFYPRRRFDQARVRKTPPVRRHQLHDDLQLMPMEVAELLGSEPPRAGGPVIGVVKPVASRDPVVPKLTALSRDRFRGLLERNLYRRATDGDYPSWLDLGYGEAPADAEGLLNTGCVEFTFHVEPGGGLGLEDPLGALTRAVKAAGP